ncbi:hypothetical protein [Halorussus marinus]|uniref:hypothetical protein n=1 Tax=Halorussus marinus TaxID=2505976 RepID=UPI00106EA483|nr:hypothetical protein [Halorussus marinus]
MRFRADDRGVTVQIGAVLLFAILIVLVSTYQATVVPQQNEQVEYNHNQRVHGELQELRDEVYRAAATGTGGSATVSLGTRYPERALFVNPAPPSGRLATSADASLRIRNAAATGEVGDYWDGTARPYPTRGLTYEPRYSVYQDPPTTVYRNGVLYNRFADATVTLAGQRLVQGDRISVVTLDGTVSESTNGVASVNVRPVSATTRTVSVQNSAPDEDLTIVVPTQLDAGEWEGLLEGELDEDGTDPDKHVSAVEPVAGEDAVRVVLEPGTYDLQMAEVGVGSDASETSPTYAVDVDGDGAVVREDGTRRVVVEVRDEYNNHVSGVDVTVTTDPSKGRLYDAETGDESDQTVRTDSDGRATFVYEPTAAVTGTETDSFALGFDGPDDDDVAGSKDTEEATYEVEVSGSGGGGGGGGGLSGRLTYNEDAVADDGPDDGTTPGGINFSVTNEYNQSVAITDIRIEPADADIDVLADRTTGEGKLISEVFVDGNESDGYVDFSSLGFPGGQDGTAVPDAIDLDLDGRANDGNPVVSSDDEASIYLYEFFTDSNDASNVDMNGEAVSITIRYRLEDRAPGDSQAVGETEFTVTPGSDGGGDGGDGGSGNLTYTGTYRTVEGTEAGVNSILQVDIRNELADAVDVTAVKVNDTTGPAQQIRETQLTAAEIEIDANGDGAPDSTADSFDGYAIGDRIDFDGPATMDGGTVGEVQFFEFRKNNGDPVDMTNRRITMTVYYETASGETRTTTFTIEP